MPDKIMLSPEEQARLEGLDSELRRLRAELARATEAGIDVSQLTAMLDQAESLRKGLLKVYGQSTRRIGTT
jgi:hypothetical protein